MTCDTSGMAIPTVIDCIDCGGRAHLIELKPNDGDPEPGDIAVFRCEDCNDRWDIVLEDDDL